MPPAPARASFLRPTLLAAAVLALLAVVALASRSDRPARPGSSADRSLPLEFWDYLLTFGLLALLGVLVLALVVRPPVRAPARGRFGFAQLLGVVLITGLFALAGTRYEWPTVGSDQGIEEAVVGSETVTSPPQQEAERPTRDTSRPLEFRWEIFVAAGALLALAASVYVVRRARQEPWTGEHEDAASALSEVLDESVDDLRAERDARRAVIAAYARMERALERNGFPRLRSEAPLEYLARVLRELRVRSGAVLALTELFERAKFSRHRIDSEMKDEAIDALLAVRDDLAVRQDAA